MFKVYDCIANAHDLRLVFLAAVVCMLSSFAAITLLRHARGPGSEMRAVWLGVSAMAIGFGIWATHFIAMLAFTPGIPSAYNIGLTILSLVAAIVLTGCGLTVAAIANGRVGFATGGAIVAGGIAAMHYTGMSAFEIAGTLSWDPTLVVVSIVLGGVIGAIALPAGLHDNSDKWKLIGAGLLTLAIVSHHFTAMGAVTIVPDPRIVVPESAVPFTWIAVGVGIASFTVILLALAGLALDLRERRRAELETDRMRGLANAAVEGLLVCDGDIIITVNDSFMTLAGSSTTHLIGNNLSTCFPDDEARALLTSQPNKAFESNLRDLEGALIPVELIMRPIDYAGRIHQVIAVRDLRARKKSEQHIRFLAHHDSLTSLPNRGHFNARLDEEMSAAHVRGEKLAVLCLDLDRFKEVNDLFGHAAGDSVLKTVATKVSTLLNEGDMMARLGGDEFAVMMTGLISPTAASNLAERILEALRVKGGNTETDNISSSIGIAVFPDDATDRETLLSHADTALYRAKQDGRGVHRFFEARMGAEVRDRRLLEHDLRHAILRNEMRLVYQPQRDMQSNTVTGFEALLRWRHPVRGDISPTIFIPIAEESGAIIEIGSWVLKTACREAVSWDQSLTIAVNVSAVQLYDPNFVNELHEILMETGLSPQRLEIEITETALVRDFNRALTTLRRVKAFGIRIAMDDFGTGYSSLSNLRAFPFDKIKIDGSFIKSVNANAQAATIVRAVLGLGRGLGLPVLAEGVETNDELSFLREELCDEVQGYLVGRPGAIANFRSITHNAEAAEDPATPHHAIAS